MRYPSHSWEPHEYLQAALIFSNTLKEITLFEETGEPQMLFWEAQNASGRQADIRTLLDAFATEK